MANRGIIDLVLNGEHFELVPSFKNLDKLETVLNKGAVGFLRNDVASGTFKAGDVVSIIQICAAPINGRHPKWWTRDGIGDVVMNEGLIDVTTKVTQFIAAALSAGSDTDIKTVESEDDQKK